jgi:hypothetical protein
MKEVSNLKGVEGELRVLNDERKRPEREETKNTGELASTIISLLQLIHHLSSCILL